MKGQITIFVALVFMVLFTLFGMTISMGMFIHDKINLQNATDLASYYVATKQAEMLTAIAHSNYQIRQSWKLAAFRYRVLGNGARTNGGYRHPGTYPSLATFENQHTVDYRPAKEFVNSSGDRIPPRICIGATHMFKELAGDNPCKTINFNVNYVRTVPAIIPISIVGVTNNTITDANLSIAGNCIKTSYANWWFSNTIIGSHKLEQRDRRAVINALAENLAKPIALGGMKDLEGRDVYEGARKTFFNNLSESNRENPDTANIEFQNSMEGLDPETWLKPIYINTIIPYSFMSTATGCTEELYTHVNSAPVMGALGLSTASEAVALKGHLDPDDQIEYYGSLAGNTSDPLMNLTVGVEKNPWYMVYNKATSDALSKPLFLSKIFGAGIKMKSIGYSKPFGGRIGPWYKMQWSSGSPESDSGDRTDPLLPPRVDVGDLGTPADVMDKTLRPNYSRYPGDEDGLTSKAAMVASGKVVGSWGISSPTNVETSLFHYHRATYSYTNPLGNDPLAQNLTGSADPWDAFNRRLEIAAIAPDMFDMTYYTIVPGFYDYFVDGPDGKLKDWLPVEDGMVKGDIGSHDQGPDGIKNFDIIDQMNISSLTMTEDGIPRERRAPWLDNPNKKGFLSSWIPGTEVMNYDPADQGDVKDRFAACGTAVPNGRAKIPSECLNGGRAGYSVKMISKKYLEADHPIGGEGTSGPILNIY